MQTVSVIIPATHMDIRLPGEHLRTLLVTNHVSDEIINGCELALQELLTNLVDHAYEGDASKSIIVNITCNSRSILIETEDTGIRADIEINDIAMPDPSELAEGGYGIALIQTIMDEVKYTSKDGRNVWQLIKRI